MFARIEENREEDARNFPQEILEGVTSTLQKDYGNLLIGSEKLKSYGRFYQSEVVLMASVREREEDRPESSSAVTVFVSMDLTPSFTKKIEENVSFMVEVISLVLDHFFSERQSYEMIPFYQKEMLDGKEFYYKTSRENIELTIKANELLKD